jgi:hypothetical protein
MADFRYNKAGLLQTNFKVHGLHELEVALKQLRKELAGKKEENIVANALRKSAKETMLASMRDYMARHSKSSRLYYALDVKRHPNPASWTELFGIGVHKLGQRPRKGEKPDNKHLPWYAAIVEYGGKGKKSEHRGWMRRKAEENSGAFITLFTQDAGRRIEVAAKKIGSDNLRAVGAKIRGLGATRN